MASYVMYVTGKQQASNDRCVSIVLHVVSSAKCERYYIQSFLHYQ